MMQIDEPVPDTLAIREQSFPSGSGPPLPVEKPPWAEVLVDSPRIRKVSAENGGQEIDSVTREFD